MKIVVLDGYTLNPGDLSWDGFRELGDLTVHDRTFQADVLNRSEGAEILLTNKTLLPKHVLESLPDLKYVGVLATGYNVIDMETAAKRNIVVTNTPAYGVNSVAQMTMALLLELCHHVQRHSDSVKAGKWAASDDFCYWEHPMIELTGKNLGIIGFGHIGSKVADMAAAFGMNILAVGRTKTDQSHRKNFTWVEMSELLEQSDVVSIHCPLTPETEGLINKESLGKMKKSALLINTARGPIINEQELAIALNEGVIAGAALDVLSQEPPSPDNPLYAVDKCIITPHIAWATREARSRLMAIAVDNLKGYLEGNIRNRVG